MPTSLKQKLIHKKNIDQIDDTDSILDDFMDETLFVDIHGNEYKDNYMYFEYDTEGSIINGDDDDDDDEYYSTIDGIELDAISNAYKYNIEDYDKFHYDMKSAENHSNSIYSNICYFLSFLDLIKQIR
jgi:hypothetical protein